jgi:hypothetical protein
MKFDMGVMPLGTTVKSYLFPTTGNNNMVGKQTCEVGLTLAPLAIGPYNDVWL